jgi:hypothetical protein
MKLYIYIIFKKLWDESLCIMIHTTMLSALVLEFKVTEQVWYTFADTQQGTVQKLYTHVGTSLVTVHGLKFVDSCN